MVLIFIYKGDMDDLGLTFSVSDASFGSNKEIDLIPGGSRISVCASNRLQNSPDSDVIKCFNHIYYRHRYIQLVAKYYLHDRLQKQAGAFFK
jgi:ubiquitin-protein ligase E3 C